MATTRRTIRLYYLYQATLSNGFYLPVGIIFLQQQRGFGLDIISLTQGAFGLALSSLKSLPAISVIGLVVG